jgi:hypothetical protein
VPLPEVEECEHPVTLDDAEQAENRAQALWSSMQKPGRQEAQLARTGSIGHYPFEDSSCAGSVFQRDTDDESEHESGV